MGSAAGGNEAADLYEHLGVERTATPRAIHAAYRRLALAHHPDRNGGDPAAAERFKKVHAAYRVLSDRRRRAAYDASLSRPAPAYASVLSACMLLAMAPLAMVELSASMWMTAVWASVPTVDPPVIPG